MKQIHDLIENYEFAAKRSGVYTTDF